ncbi:MAG: HD domain-containing phosphohydrolase [Pirellulales bacterium]
MLAMRSINSRLKHLVLLLAAQTGFFAIGLWVHGQVVISSVNRAAQDVAWEKLIQGPTAEDDTTRAVLVDDEWRIVSRPEAPAATHNTPAPEGQLLWTPIEEATAKSTPVRGVIEFDGQQHVAIAQQQTSGGYLVRYVPSASLTFSLGELKGSTQLAGVITLLWVSALLGLVVFLIITRLYDEQARKRSQWETQSLAQIQSLQKTRDGIVFGLAKLAEFRDQETGYHLERISAFAARLAAALRRRAKFRDRIDADFPRMLAVSAVLHDIGKVGVPDAILLKPGPLTPDERAIMQQHTQIGDQCIAEIERRLGNSNFLRVAGEIARSHHERWDGSGYPSGLSGEAIPLAARIVAIVDVYDALSSRRVYKEALPHDACVEVIRSESGRHFDPELVTVFLEIESELRDIARKYSRETAPLPPPPQLLPRCNLARENEELVAAGDVQDDGLWLAPSAPSENLVSL